MKHSPLLVLVLGWLGACATTDVDRAENAAQAMRDFVAALKDAPPKVTVVSASLAEVAKEGGDMVASYATFSRNVDALVQQREYVRNLRSEVEASRQLYSGAWEERLKSIKDADLRERASERRDKVILKFEALNKTADGCKEQFEPWMETVLDVRAYLGNDLNPGGVASVSDKIKQIDRGAVSVNKSLESIVAELDEMAKAIAAAKPPPPPATEESKSK